MGALFFKYDNTSIFKNSIGSGKVIETDLLPFLGSPEALTILTSATVQHNDTIQFFQSFGDLIDYFYFGRGLGQIHLELIMFTDCESVSAGLQQLWTLLGSKRGQEVNVSISNMFVTGILTSFTVNAIAEPETHFQVSLDLGMTKSNLSSPNISGSC